MRYLGEGQRQTRISDIVSDFGGYSFFLSVLLCRRMGSQSLLVDVDQYVTERQGLRLDRSSDLGEALCLSLSLLGSLFVVNYTFSSFLSHREQV